MSALVRALVLVLGCTLSTIAHAQQDFDGVTSPLPLLGGTTRAKHVYSIPGVTSNGNLATIVMCTSLEKKNTVDLALEVFSEDGNQKGNDVTANAGVLTGVLPGQTVTFEVALDMNGVLSTTYDSLIILPGVLAHGSARVLATSSNVMCAAGLIDPTSVAPAAMMALPVVAKTKQKGD